MQPEHIYGQFRHDSTGPVVYLSRLAVKARPGQTTYPPVRQPVHRTRRVP
jgi:hypothetical protein